MSRGQLPVETCRRPVVGHRTPPRERSDSMGPGESGATASAHSPTRWLPTQMREHRTLVGLLVALLGSARQPVDRAGRRGHLRCCSWRCPARRRSWFPCGAPEERTRGAADGTCLVSGCGYHVLKTTAPGHPEASAIRGGTIPSNPEETIRNGGHDHGLRGNGVRSSRAPLTPQGPSVAGCGQGVRQNAPHRTAPPPPVSQRWPPADGDRRPRPAG